MADPGALKMEFLDTLEFAEKGIMTGWMYRNTVLDARVIFFLFRPRKIIDEWVPNLVKEVARRLAADA